MLNRAHHGHVAFGPGKRHVQSFLAAALVDRSKIHEHSAIGSGPIADAKNDHIPLVTLNILQVLYKQSNELPVHFALQFRVIQRLELFIVLSKSI